jgi:hypothetical protein
MKGDDDTVAPNDDLHIDDDSAEPRREHIHPLPVFLDATRSRKSLTVRLGPAEK